MSQSESKPVYYLTMINPMTGSSFTTPIYTLLDLLSEMDEVKRSYPDIEICATVLPANKQAWLDDILTRENLK